MRRAVALVAVFGAGLVACGALGPGGTGAAVPEDLPGDDHCSEGSAHLAGEAPVESAPEDPDSRFPWFEPEPTAADDIDLEDDLVPGGPPPDGIPSIDDPCFAPVRSGGAWLRPQSPVLSLDVGGDARAYPLAIMTRHEIVNDVVGGQPVVVTYCPLCNSGLAFQRTVEGDVLDFGTSGRLYRANLVMYDRQHKNLWVQFTGRAVAGDEWLGTELERIPTGLVGWEEFRSSFPDGWVLTRETGFERDYGRNPYVRYEDSGVDFMFDGPIDDALPPQTRVVGIGDEADALAIPLDVLREHRVVEATVSAERVTVVWAPGAASAVDSGDVDRGRDVGQSGAFRARAPDGQPLTLRPVDGEDGRFVDEETSSRWDVFGRAVAGPLEGHRLEEVSRDDTWWFVWFAFHPETRIHAEQEVNGDGGG